VAGYGGDLIVAYKGACERARWLTVITTNFRGYKPVRDDGDVHKWPKHRARTGSNIMHRGCPVMPGYRGIRVGPR
jgi:hypothetical protein